MPTNEERYEEIMRRIAARNQPKVPTSPTAAALNALGVVDMLEDAIRRTPHMYISAGPAVKRGQNWTAVLIWRRRKGMGGYKQMELFGVWAVEREDNIWISAGSRRRGYSAPVYTAEAFHKLFKHDFSVYYEDNGGPPADKNAWLFASYNDESRLELRTRIEALLPRWQAGQF